MIDSIINNVPYLPKGISWINSNVKDLWNGRSVVPLDSNPETPKPVNNDYCKPDAKEILAPKEEVTDSNQLQPFSQFLETIIKTFQNSDLIAEFAVSELFTCSKRDEKNLRLILSNINKFFLLFTRKVHWEAPDFKWENAEWIDSLKTVWKNKAEVVERAKTAKNKPKSLLRQHLLKLHKICSTEELLRKTATEICESLTESEEDLKATWINFLNLSTYIQNGITQVLVSDELSYSPSIALALKPLVPQYKNSKLSPFAQHLLLIDYFKTKNIAGVPLQLEDIVMAIAASYDSSYQSISKVMGIHPERGMVLYGPPGTGKTVVAKAIAEYFGCMESEIEMTSGSNLLDKWVGGTEKAIRGLFEKARKHPQRLHVIVIDEIEALLASRDKAQSSWQTSQVTQFLTELDGINSPQNIFVIGITNYIDMLDQAAIRPGRLGTLIEVPLPDLSQRTAIFELYLKKIDKEYLTEEYEILAKELAEKTPGLSGAEIKAIVQRTSNDVFIKIIKERHFSKKDQTKSASCLITMEDFIKTIKLIESRRNTS